jgi:aspartyl-tRNA(Asn)/glutamyl-tRNA(Gln) amidotransferase subunit A
MRSAIELAAAVRARKLSAQEAVAAALAAIGRHDGRINSFVHVDAAQALAAARAVDDAIARGDDPGPLAGVPFGAKDNEIVKGMPTRQGSLLLKDAAPETTDAVHITRLRAAGAIPIGKVAMSEFGLDGVTHTIAHGTTRNPWKLERTPAGSSGGSSAAVAGGLVPFCTGSDGFGSIRCPAGFTGLVGLKPSLGRIPRADGFKDTATFGALTMTVADTAHFLDVVAGPHDRDRMSLPASSVSYERAIETLDLTGRRAAFSADMGFAPVTDEMRAICEGAVQRMCKTAGIELEPKPFTVTNAYIEWNALAARILRAQFEAAGFWPDPERRISPGPRSFIERFGTLSAHDEIACLNVLKTLEREVAALFERVDFLITPTACCEAYAAEGPLPEVIEGRDAGRTNAEPYTSIGSVCWNPSVSVPAGLTRAGLPAGLLINGPRHRDDMALRLARLWECEAPWPRVAPGYDRD